MYFSRFGIYEFSLLDIVYKNSIVLGKINNCCGFFDTAEVDSTLNESVTFQAPTSTPLIAHNL